MKILGIESSCDETAAAIVEDGRRLLSNVVNSQIDIHAVYGGVVPEVAARSHIEVINPVINQALTDANCTWDDIDGIAVTYAPGLIGSLLIGTLAARTLAILKNKPLYPIHHVEAHVYANFLNEKTPEFPMLALIVSGGHSQLVLFRDHGDYELLGQTCDDAVGEAFDKVAKIIGLAYPGGPSIAAAAKNGNPLAYKLPKSKLSGAYDFSFSGLKTAVLRAVQNEVGVDITFPSTQLAGLLTDARRNDFAASFQRIAVETLVDKTERAYFDFDVKSVIIAGGVAANSELRRILSDRIPVNIDYAPMNLCTDNAAMVATMGYYYALKNQPTSPYDLEVAPSLSMAKSA
ncbi:tRNA (adenosine(37)-N6)-threonylcarbamoyltransferase complex transferase subunit TsaD [Candidatus Saccharibacteria bacterium CG11_big_fil_rev_8_21_14_0_20_41_19]|nr:tRNA (adenosine(37)-N6)-threonylcarbamoyltransferase complex transferase subunit TsaD [Candidatus Saccharibacteria bacterium]OIP85555.1 MAG: tRNA (adenosine(37)-N6)-threonylcarbamoyltransferase complex transferase subunit TsaD [Candidatus Saccharibacteria bacterium CG2_30_41_52]PIQ70717.1 MAG: tRNA (adenosine(37)-N6)-threonylcarbamoyltransferase complex transferase subunit TsaD [Candidatus Saccharibacteria bacterium CG11_big_fil_rev_8_21_14_0_20_41_19]PIZ59298.1 MAG: tRNA (adenosine(37)-N6)-t